MSGLAGAVTLGRGVRPDVDTVSRMLEALEGRRWGPRRIWGDGHAILAYRFTGTPDCDDLQPVVDVPSGVAIVVDAHLGNREKLRRQLGATRDGDAHLILAAYARWGDDFVEHLDGEFAVVLVDRTKRKVLLARDALGVKPLYVADTAGGLLFASTLPAVLAAGGLDTSIDPEALHHYLSRSSVVPAPRTIVKGVRKLPPATLRVIDADGTRDRVYWKPDRQSDGDLERWSQHEWHDAAHEALLAAVRSRLPGSGPVSVLLSGGLDSSLLVALLADCHRGGINTFSIGFDSSEGVAGDEFEYSSVVARRFGTTHHCLHVPTAELVPAVAAAVEDMAEPMAAHEAPAFHLLARHASEHTDTVMSGQGADEVLGGAVDHRSGFGAELEPLGDAVRMTRVWGVEATMPFLDRHLVELAVQHPERERGGSDVLAALGRHLLPDDVVHRPKGHLLLPALMNLDGPVLGLVRDTLSSQAARGREMLQPHVMETLLAAQRGSALPAGVNGLWQLTVLEMWLQRHRV
ncbi:N-acetylglutaminylglutamine amidotransferase [Tessaracoccus sp. MC1627]|uniref:asparagine synthase-related protein n=1 Tax=Tessaracoccus sp. MC1627 TaxID=2760312 RepID=UPI001602B7F3|nr:asparagine synthase-related protein [Tessaracoccus sp. MC1627]MBB1512564.1 N-acetylglutaminylglutamine amidotransferase [Tessaracoccus sp. MC1627]